MTVRVAINGFGRIGRNVLRAALEQGVDDLEFVAINARSSDNDIKAHLFKYDSLYDTYPEEVTVEGEEIIIGQRKFKGLTGLGLDELPWKDLGIDIVIESSGAFRTRETAEKHLTAGAKKVVITAPAKNEDITIVMGINEDQYQPDKHHILSNASCTTNCLAPVAKVLDEGFGIIKAQMTTVHAYTNDQNIHDARHKDLRRARAGALSMIPTTTGAAKAVSLVLPQLEGKINGMAIRVPTPTVSLVDLVALVNKKVNGAEEVNDAFEKAAAGPLKGILGYSDKPLVSIDYKKSNYSTIVDGLSTTIVDGDLVKVLAWYDNEWGYSCRVLDLVRYIGNKGV
ncbi:MAG: type I glyceraldehyde-3-phosphate dehydrogenase [Clostridia bacterium]|jgi:glyceraldehyde 3-phosphate dehydrogenase|nr:type I glyceraldehyde-3-phosphate dehydrogenase [Clostridiales bacterium]